MSPSEQEFPDDDGAGTTPGRRLRLTERLTALMLKAPKAQDAAPPPVPTSVDELEAVVHRADDRERLIGLLLAPLAALIGLLVPANLAEHDHLSRSLYEELGLVTLLLAVGILLSAWFRKRTAIGVFMALDGLTIFNLHYWGFGLPFVLGGAWYLVRAYRYSERLKAARGTLPGQRWGSGGSGPRPSKRYTPPKAPPGGAPKSKPDKGLEAG